MLKYVNKSLMGNDRPLISKEQKMRKILPDGLQPAVWSLAVNMTELRKLRPAAQSTDRDRGDNGGPAGPAGPLLLPDPPPQPRLPGLQRAGRGGEVSDQVRLSLTGPERCQAGPQVRYHRD